jgi:hydrogenase maturation protein HypF
MAEKPKDRATGVSLSQRLFVKVLGTVQGVGFRPFVYGLATGLGLKGFVANTGDGVAIEVEGAEAGAFVERLSKEAPPLAAIRTVEITAMPPHGYDDFSILESESGGSFTHVSPDVSVCDDCLGEMLDPSDRRYRYPFINCTNCGPRYTITMKTPYDRPNTTMAPFKMCPECQREYDDPSNRRFHAQPNACPECGPTVRLLGDGEATGETAIGEIKRLLRDGRIVAIKGLGGYHLACDAENSDAVRSLREKKRRNRKPFALMAPNVEAVREFCDVSDEEEKALLSAKRPIVLLKRKPGALPEGLAPGNSRLGFMLPYTPLHYLIVEDFKVLVMTSGNLSEEPIQVSGEGARGKLGGIADAFLDHDRGIFMRADDSVVKLSGPMRFVRRSRGYTPEPVALAYDGPDVLGVGADIKNSFTLMRGAYAIVSQHIGDMENLETLEFFEETLNNLKSVYRAEPVALAHDLHPGYLSTQWALKQKGIKKLGVQHHHAHIASVMAEHGLGGKVIGVALDGTGYGADGTLWGGEFLVADAREFRRAGHLGAVPLPGGEQAVKEPWRTAVSYLREATGGEAKRYLKDIGFFDRYGQDRINAMLSLAGMEEFSPLSSGAGRLFDAVSALLGICDESTFEGEAAMALESAAAEGEKGDYPIDITLGKALVVDFSFAVIGMIEDIKRGVARETIAARFQNTVVTAVLRVVQKLAHVNVINDVALSGGVFQNDYLLRNIEAGLRGMGYNVYSNVAVPLNDGGISLGQAHILREKLKAGDI